MAGAVRVGDAGGDMEEVFEVEGMTLLSWRTKIEARDEAEALEIAQRLADWSKAPNTVVTVETLSHRVASCQRAVASGE
jgi:hypothetical protein